MAPKRGGSSSSSSGSSGGSSYSSGSSYDSSPKSAWLESTILFGSHFRNEYQLAVLVANCLAFLALLGIAIWSSRIKNAKVPGRRMFRWYGLGLSLFCILAALGLDILDRFLSETETVVARIYVIVYILTYFFFFWTDILLIWVVYGITRYCLQQIPSFNSSVVSGLHWLHRAVVILLAVLALTAFGFYTDYQVADGRSYATYLLRSNSDSSYNTSLKLTAAFNFIFLIAAFEILVLLVLALVKIRGTSKRITIYAVALVAVPLFIRSLYNAASVGTQLQGIYSKVQITTPLYIVFSLFFNVVVFAGVVLVALRRDWIGPYPGDGTMQVPYGPGQTQYAPNGNGFAHDKTLSPQVNETQYQNGFGPQHNSLPAAPAGHQWVARPLDPNYQPPPTELQSAPTATTGSQVSSMSYQTYPHQAPPSELSSVYYPPPGAAATPSPAPGPTPAPGVAHQLPA
ncbi:MAG: hypothetical protein M1825_005821 [Sarcosagium campestre]|nr:MAG: hypothetical protein M1825_005821 [Sarcosagium campestre]